MVTRNVYVGHRYVPLIMGEWLQTETYEGLSIVTHQGSSYTSKKRVPIGIPISNEEYWVITGNYNAQIESYRQDIVTHKEEINKKLADHIHSSTYVTGDGTDETAAFQQMLNDGVGKVVHISKPISKYKIGKIDIPSNSNIFIQSGTVVEIIQGVLPLSFDAWVNLYEKENVFISGYGVNFNMIKSDYPVGGEWNHNFYIRGCKNLYIEGVAANNSGGDGFYIGQAYIAGSKQNENVTLYEVKANNNARQGISLCTGRNMSLIRPVCTNSSGSSPQAGIDLEIEGDNPICENWTVVSPYTSGNKGAGIAFNPSKLANTGKIVDINITDHRDTGSQFGFHAFAGVAGVVAGIVKNTKPVLQNNVGGGLLLNDYGIDMPLIDVENPLVINANTANTANSLFDAGIAVIRDVSAVSTNDYIGNLRVEKPMVIDSRGVKQISSGIYSSDLKGLGVKKCYLTDPIQLDAKNVMLNIKGEWIIKDSNKLLTFKDVGSASVSFYNRQVVRHNKDATAQIVMTLSPTTSIGTVVTFEVRAAQTFRIVPPITSKIHPLSVVSGKYIQSNVIGSKVKLELIDTDTWIITEQVGTWTVEA